MPHVKQETYRSTRVTDPATDSDESEVIDNSSAESLRRLQNFVLALIGALTTLLTLRFLLALFGANPANPFANFIYDLTRPLIAPFIGLFNLDATIDLTSSRLEVETLTAIAVYYLLGWAVVRLISAGHKNSREVV